MSEDIKAVEPLAERIIRAIKAWFECLKYDYQERVERGPMAHLMGICTEHIMALCRILDEINEMEQAEAVLEDSEHSRARAEDCRSVTVEFLEPKLRSQPTQEVEEVGECWVLYRSEFKDWPHVKMRGPLMTLDASGPDIRHRK